MIKPNLYLIKYYGDFCGKASNVENPYYAEGSGWVKDPRFATQYKKEKAIFKMGQILEEQELITKLIHIDDVPKIMNPSPPKAGFFLVCDVDGEVRRVFDNNVDKAVLINAVQFLDENMSLKSPHAIWTYGQEGFCRVFL